MSYSTDTASNDTACAHCGQPMIGLRGGWCADCCGLPPAERSVYVASAELEQRLRVSHARRALPAFGNLALGALHRHAYYVAALAGKRIVKQRDGEMVDASGLAAAAARAAQAAYDDTRAAVRAAFVLRADLRAERAA